MRFSPTTNLNSHIFCYIVDMEYLYNLISQFNNLIIHIFFKFLKDEQWSL